MNFMNPYLGIDSSEEQQRRMLGMALLSGGAGALANSSLPPGMALGRGMQSMMGSLEQQQQMALQAQMQALQRKQIQNAMEMRQKEFEAQGARFEREMSNQERQLGMSEQRLGLEEKRLGISEKAAGMQQAEYTRKMEEEQARQQSAMRIQQLMQQGAKETELAQAIAAHTMRFGGTPSSNVNNVLLPSGKSGTGSLFADLLGGGGMAGQPGQAELSQAIQQGAQAQQGMARASTLSEGLGVAEEMDAAKQAARDAMADQIRANQFVTKVLPAAQAQRGWGAPDKEEAKRIIDMAEQLFPSMNDMQKKKTAEVIKELKERFGL